MTTPFRARSVAVVVLAVVVVCGVLIVHVTGGQRPAPHTPHADNPRSGEHDAGPPSVPPAETAPGDSAAGDAAAEPVRVLPDTPDPGVYAVAVAEVLFGMDHSRHNPADYTAVFDAALWDGVTAQDRDRILTVIGERIPTAVMWAQMQSINQTATFEVEAVWEPRIAERHRVAGDWPDGWQMRTVSGTQTEAWQPPGEDTQTSSRPVAVTIAMACPPAAAACRLIGIGPHVES